MAPRHSAKIYNSTKSESEEETRLVWMWAFFGSVPSIYLQGTPFWGTSGFWWTYLKYRFWVTIRAYPQMPILCPIPKACYLDCIYREL